MSEVMQAIINGLALLDRCDLFAARKLISELKEQNPENPAALFLEGAIILRQGMGESAINPLKKAADVLPESKIVSYYLQLAMEAGGQLQVALSQIEELCRKYPADPLFALSGGVISERIGDDANAETFFRRAAAKSPKGFAAWDGLARLFERSDRKDEANRLRSRMKAEKWVGLPLKGPRAESPVFIVGAGHSGTTLLHRLLANHDALVPTLGGPGQEDQQGWLRFGGGLTSGTGDSGEVFGFPYNIDMDVQLVTPEIATAMHSYYFNSVMMRDENKRVLNKNPAMSNKIPYIRAIFPDAKFVHVVRDVVPFSGSWKRSLDNETKDVVFYWPDAERANGWFMPCPTDPWGRSRQELFANQDRFYPGGGFARLPEFWKSLNTNILAEQSKMPDTILTIRYEDLCADLARTLTKVFEFLNLPPEVGQLEPVSSANGKSSTYLTEDEQEICTKGTSELRRILGY